MTTLGVSLFTQNGGHRILLTVNGTRLQTPPVEHLEISDTDGNGVPDSGPDLIRSTTVFDQAGFWTRLFPKIAAIQPLHIVEQLVVFRGKRLLGLGGHGNLPKGGKHPCEWSQSSGACHAPQ